jgi:hypothetical protein
MQNIDKDILYHSQYKYCCRLIFCVRFYHRHKEIVFRFPKSKRKTCDGNYNGIIGVGLAGVGLVIAQLLKLKVKHVTVVLPSFLTSRNFRNIECLSIEMRSHQKHLN